MSIEQENNLYARWLINDLTAEERQLIAQNGDEELFKKIVETVDNWSLPDLKEETFGNTKKKISNLVTPKIIPLYKKTWFISAAASVVLIIMSVWFFAPKQVTIIACNVGETKKITLPDNTEVTLFGNSKLSYTENNFPDTRIVSLDGEGYFDVHTKGHFTVNFADGTVKVLGTKFNILSDKNFSSVKCFEGKVEVNIGAEKCILEKGNGVRKIKSATFEKYNLKNTTYNAEENENHFDETPLAEVCATISLYFNVSFVTNDVNLERNFTGVYKKSNLDSALFMVFEPMGISFKQDGRQIILKNK